MRGLNLASFLPNSGALPTELPHFQSFISEVNPLGPWGLRGRVVVGGTRREKGTGSDPQEMRKTGAKEGGSRRKIGTRISLTFFLPVLRVAFLVCVAASFSGPRKGTVINLLKPNFCNLLTSQIWCDALGQVFISISLGIGSINSFSSGGGRVVAAVARGDRLRGVMPKVGGGGGDGGG